MSADASLLSLSHCLFLIIFVNCTRGGARALSAPGQKLAGAARHVEDDACSINQYRAFLFVSKPPGRWIEKQITFLRYGGERSIFIYKNIQLFFIKTKRRPL